MIIGTKADLDVEKNYTLRVVAKPNSLITDRLPKKFRTLDRYGIARQYNRVIRMNSGLVRVTESAALSS
jgi:hypothetical protein